MHLRFKAIKPILEANLIDLPDVDPIYAVKAADETVQLIPRAVFLRLFEEISVDISVRRKAVPAKSSRRVKKYTYVDKDAKPLYETTVAANPPASPEAKVRKPSPMAEKCLRILDQHGPLTTPELSGHPVSGGGPTLSRAELLRVESRLAAQAVGGEKDGGGNRPG